MRKRQLKWVCTHCGYSASKRFDEDICPRCHLTFWKCSGCAFTLIANGPPGACPECGAQETFVNISCYIPDWDEPEAPSPLYLPYRV